ncbi:GNAT family protein [Erwinia sp.]|uniref:GNAT family N-acetyltransferase n=1 Tax=Erwinia citreus TaxID=558 RepID=UPI002897E885|nr:GNAT family protein [Erwinia sp.]
MSVRLNKFQQPVGEALPEWAPRPLPERQALVGRFCVLEPLESARHYEDLLAAWGSAEDGRDWTYLPAGPFNAEELRDHLAQAEASRDPLHFAVIDRQSGRAVGTLALMRIEPAHGVMEVGYVTFSPALQRTPLSTESHFLLMRYAFDELGYRRYEWKCDSLNAPSRRAAERLGFRYEGLFRQAIVYKGRSRDTAWFSIIDEEWPALREAFERWLDASNFDAAGVQRRSLADLRQQRI